MATRPRIVGTQRARFDATGLLPAPELKTLLIEVFAQLTEGRLQIVIEKRYSSEEIAAAHAHVDRGHKKGNVVLRVAPGDWR